MSCIIVVAHQKSKRPSYKAKFKYEVVQCAEDKGNCKATEIFGDDESNIRQWWKHYAAISMCEVQKKFIVSENKLLKLMMNSLCVFFSRDEVLE
jgi:hypothetical protein